MGRGGAAFPTGRKWAAVATQPAQPHYLVCNADESEPGHVQGPGAARGRPVRRRRGDDDRRVRDGREPAATSTSAASTRRRRRRVRDAIAAARARRPARRRHPGLGLRVRHRAPARRRRLHLRRGDGALRVDRGQARRAAQQAAVPGRGRAVRQADGRQQRRDAGQHPAHPRDGRRGLRRDRDRGLDRARSCSACPATSRGPASTRSSSARPCATSSSSPAASRGGRGIRAILLGGAAGVFVGPDALDLPLTFEATRAAGATLGSGVIMVFDETVDLVGHAAAHRPVLPRRVVRPVRPVPGRQRPPGGAAGAAGGRVAGPRRATRSSSCSRDIGQAMRDASICGLGQTASSAIESALRQPGLVAL